jgi:hypothetical protein
VNPFQGANSEEVRRRVLLGQVPPASTVGLRPPPCFDWICEKALAQKPQERFQSAEEMMVQLRRIAGREELIASPSQVAQWVRTVCHDRLEARRKLVRPSQAPPAPEAEAPLVPRFQTAQAQHRTLSRPPSSYATREKTEALPSRPMAAPEPEPPRPASASPAATSPRPAAAPEPPFALPLSRTRTLIHYVAISCVLLLLVVIFFAPERLSAVFTRGADRDAVEAPKAAPVQPKTPNPASDSKVTIPEIRPVGK